MAVDHWSNCTNRLIELVSRPRFGVITDFDGTLSPYVQQPHTAVITPENAAALDALAPLVSVIALTSGRAAADLRGRFERPWAVYYGNHGMERWRSGDVEVMAEAARWQAPLRDLLAAFGTPNIAGVVVEAKRVTASVHYRGATDPAATRETLFNLLAPLAQQHGLVLSEGQYIWEIKPPLAFDKGTAVQAIVSDYHLDAALFLGDDVTDFTAMRQLRLLADHTLLRAASVGVTHPTSPAEIYTVCDMTANGVDDSARLLHWLVAQRLNHPIS